MLTMIRPVIASIFVFTMLTGTIYPLVVTGIAQVLFPEKANGSLIFKGNRPVGSALIGQSFDDPKYFWGRLSATLPIPYNSAASSGSNLAQTNPALINNARLRINALGVSRNKSGMAVPVDLVTSSGSGLDPDISPAAADYQVSRVAKGRGITEAEVRVLIARYTEDRQLGIFGEPRVNVLKLNLALDALGHT